MVRSRRTRMRDASSRENQVVARREIAAIVSAAISLRAIAPEMGLTDRALDRSFPSRDGPIPALILDAYHAVANALGAARDALAPWAVDDRRFVTLLAHRAWALAHPVQDAPIFGGPIPGYRAPTERWRPAAERPMTVDGGDTDVAWRAVRLRPSAAEGKLPPTLERALAGWGKSAGFVLPAAGLRPVLAERSRIPGLITPEIFGHTGDLLDGPGSPHRFQDKADLRILNLDPDSEAAPPPLLTPDLRTPIRPLDRLTGGVIRPRR